MRKSIYSLEKGDLCYNTMNFTIYCIDEIIVKNIDDKATFTFKLHTLSGKMEYYSEESLIHRCVYIPDAYNVTKSYPIFVPKQKFQIGDKITVPEVSPKSQNVGDSIAPVWASSMNKFLGRILTVKSTNRCYIEVEENPYIWFSEWFAVSSKLDAFLRETGDFA